MKDLFDNYEDEFLRFDRVEHKFSQRADLHAFILLDKLVPGSNNIVSDSSHDEIGLSIDPESLAVLATEDQLRDLHRCGVRHDVSLGFLAMFM